MKKLYEKLFILIVAFTLMLTPTINIDAQTPVKTKKLLTEKEKDSKIKESERIKKMPIAIKRIAGQKNIVPLNVKRMRNTPVKSITTGAGTTLYGALIFADTWTSTNAPYGVYSFPASSSTSFTSVHLDETLVSYSGVYVAGKYYANTAIEDILGNTTYYQVVYDTQDWSVVSTDEISLPALALTYDPVGDKVYALTYNATAQTFSELSVYDYLTAGYTKVGDVPALITLSANASGDLYGVGKDGKLYSINKTTGASTLIGATGITPKYIQSATFDPVSGKLYWAACLSDDTANLYEIDLTTGVASLISAFANNEEVAGLYIPAPAAASEAPAAATDLALTFTTPGALTGKVSFKVPATTFSGATLSENVSGKISITGIDAIDLTNLAPGSTYESDVLNLAAGSVTVDVVISNSQGNSPKTTLTKWVGGDVPAAVTNFKLEKDVSGKAKLSWTAPSAGLHDGYFDASTLTYKIIRVNDSETVATGLTATTYIDETISENLAFYSYSITPVNAAGEGVVSVSNSLALGSSLSVPYSETFESADALNLWTIIDVNNDTKTWKYQTSSKSVYYGYSSTKDADDWLITPPIKLKAGITYKLTYKTKAASATYPESLKVTLGDGSSASAQTTVLADYPSLKNTTLTPYSQTVTVPSDGDYYFGFYAYTVADSYNLFIDDVSVEELSAAGAPGPVTDLSLNAGATGELSATISFKAPATAFGGGSISGITAIDIYRNGGTSSIKTFTNPALGASLSFTDNSPVNGFNTYKIVPANESGLGIATTDSLYVGIDVPDTIASVVLTNVNENAVLNWVAPTVGVHGGYINPSDLKYKVENSDGDVLASDLTETTYTDATIAKDVQTFAYYFVTPYNAQGEGVYTASNGLVFGPAYPAPFAESFSNGSLQNSPWITSIIEGESAGWSLGESGQYPTAAAQDGDNGLVTFNAFTTDAGTVSRLISPALDISSLSNPRLTFWLYHYQSTLSSNDSIHVEISKDNGEFQVLEGAQIALAKNNNGWTQYQFPLTAFAGETKINLAFRAYSGYGYNIHIDNISIKDSYTHELIAQSITGPSTQKIGSTATYSVTVKNDGSVAESAYSIELYKDGDLLDTKAGSSIAVGSSLNFDFATDAATLDDAGKTYVFTAKVVFEADENKPNNTTSSVSTKVATPTVPSVTDLSGSLTGKTVTLTWTEPVTASGVSKSVTTDDFESYAPFIINNIGSWTLNDVDGADTYVIEGVSEYDNAGDPMAFQVFNPESVGVTSETWKAHSGSQYLINFDAATPPNNDWLISPELSGAEQTMSFFAKSIVDTYGLERIIIYYSTTDKDPASFTKLSDGDYLSVPTAWTEYTYSLPAGAKYFAIRSVSDDAFALLVDDITYDGAAGGGSQLTLLGYNVYKNGSKLTSAPTGETTYTDADLADGDYTYKVTAVYETGESVYSNEVKIKVLYTGINDLTSGLKIFSTNKYIVVEGAEGEKVTVRTIDGKQIHSSQAGESLRIPVSNSGVYLVNINGTVAKVLVK